MVIDAHHHVWDLAVRDQDWISGEQMAPIRRTFTLDDLRPSARAAWPRYIASAIIQTRPSTAASVRCFVQTSRRIGSPPALSTLSFVPERHGRIETSGVAGRY